MSVRVSLCYGELSSCHSQATWAFFLHTLSFGAQLHRCCLIPEALLIHRLGWLLSSSSHTLTLNLIGVGGKARVVLVTQVSLVLPAQEWHSWCLEEGLQLPDELLSLPSACRMSADED